MPGEPVNLFLAPASAPRFFSWLRLLVFFHSALVPIFFNQLRLLIFFRRLWLSLFLGGSGSSFFHIFHFLLFLFLKWCTLSSSGSWFFHQPAPALSSQNNWLRLPSPDIFYQFLKFLAMFFVHLWSTVLCSYQDASAISIALVFRKTDCFFVRPRQIGDTAAK